MHNSRRYLWVSIALFVVAVMIRLLAVDSLGAPPEKDALQYHQIATHLLAGGGYSLDGQTPTTIRPPVYPFFIAAVYALFGTDYHYVLIVQALLHAALVFPLCWLGLRITGSELVGGLAGGLFALHTSFEIVSRLYAENLLIPLLLGFVIFSYLACDKRQHYLRYAAGAGVMAGLMALTKPEFSLLGLAALLLALMLSHTRQSWRIWLVTAVVSLLLAGGWQLRNFSVADSGQHRLVQASIVLANCPALTGDGWWIVSDMDRLEQQRETCHRLFDNQSAELLTGKIRQMWLDEPLFMMKLVTSRVLILWASPPVGTSMLVEHSEGLRWPVLFLQYMFVLFSLGLLFWMGVRQKKLFPLLLAAIYLTAVYGLTHAVRRYGYSFVPELCLMFVYALWLAYGKLEGRIKERWDAES